MGLTGHAQSCPPAVPVTSQRSVSEGLPTVFLFVKGSANSLSSMGKRQVGSKGLSLLRECVSFLSSEPGKTQAARQTRG